MALLKQILKMSIYGNIIVSTIIAIFVFGILIDAYNTSTYEKSLVAIPLSLLAGSLVIGTAIVLKNSAQTLD